MEVQCLVNSLSTFSEKPSLHTYTTAFYFAFEPMARFLQIPSINGCGILSSVFITSKNVSAKGEMLDNK